jgi:hypothetical protein
VLLVSISRPEIASFELATNLLHTYNLPHTYN